MGIETKPIFEAKKVEGKDLREVNLSKPEVLQAVGEFTLAGEVDRIKDTTRDLNRKLDTEFTKEKPYWFNAWGRWKGTVEKKFQIAVQTVTEKLNQIAAEGQYQAKEVAERISNEAGGILESAKKEATQVVEEGKIIGHVNQIKQIEDIL